MDLEGIILREISQTEKDILHNLTYMWTVKKQKQIKLIDTENRPVTAKGRGQGMGEVGEEGQNTNFWF